MQHERIFTIRGYRRGKTARPTKCAECGATIEVGEQYYRFGEYHLCLGCYTVKGWFGAENDPVYIPSTDR